MTRRRDLRGKRFSRRPWRESPFQKGDLKYVILDLIKEKPRYGYEIIRDLEEQSHGFYTPSPGVVYPTLQMLEETGYASATERDGKRVYSITEEGRQFLIERKDLADGVKSQMRHQWDSKDIGAIGEMMGEFGELGGLLGRRLRYVDSEKIQRVHKIVTRACQEIEAILEE